jgi:signal transduction histidine kinase
MNLWQKRGLLLGGGLALALAIASLALGRGYALAVVGNLSALILLLMATFAMAANARRERGQNRLFWALWAAGCALWTVNQACWAFYEVILRRDLPDPFLGDVILFIHLVPMMAAVALRPHRPEEGKKLYFGTLNFLMLLLWWVFLYAFVVFPDEYVVLNARVYSPHYDILYLIQNLLLVTALAVAAWGPKGSWRPVYFNLLLASAAYTLSSTLINLAISRNAYHTGSLYDVPFTLAVFWFFWTAIAARKQTLEAAPAETPSPWMALAPRASMIAILSLPPLGFWTIFSDPSLPRLRYFRLLVTLAAMLVLGLFVFIRQYALDRELIRLLTEAQQSYENLERLQTELVQKEKLASLGQLVAGAAHEINNPLAAILGYSELLSGQASLRPDQVNMAMKIGQQARRTRDLVARLLSFAQQAPEEKTMVDLGLLAHRAVQMEALRLESKHIHARAEIDPDMPLIWGNANQLFQCCVQIISNASDALEESGGGEFVVKGYFAGGRVVLEFQDNGPGIREPQRVFDPFYTTKPIGKGTGLGLSATYGVVQDHKGQIGCHNRPQGGAVFTMRFPAAERVHAVGARA